MEKAKEKGEEMTYYIVTEQQIKDIEWFGYWHGYKAAEEAHNQERPCSAATLTEA